MKPKVHLFRIVIILAVIGYVTWILISQQADINKKKDAIANVDGQMQSEKIRQEELLHEQEQVGTPEYMKKLARENGMVMPDEILYVDALKGN